MLPNIFAKMYASQIHVDQLVYTVVAIGLCPRPRRCQPWLQEVCRTYRFCRCASIRRRLLVAFLTFRVACWCFGVGALYVRLLGVGPKTQAGRG